jgi:hypothetical protein
VTGVLEDDAGADRLGLAVDVHAIDPGPDMHRQLHRRAFRGLEGAVGEGEHGEGGEVGGAVAQDHDPTLSGDEGVGGVIRGCAARLQDPYVRLREGPLGGFLGL